MGQVKMIPVKDLMRNQDAVLKGQDTDVLQLNDSVLIDGITGKIIDPRDGVALANLPPDSSLMMMPRTTWH